MLHRVKCQALDKKMPGQTGFARAKFFKSGILVRAPTPTGGLA
jgi:hypothetical protein